MNPLRYFLFMICLVHFFILDKSIANEHAPSSFIIAAYYENWSQFRPAVGNRKPFSPDMIDPFLLTDLYYAFAIFGFITPSVDSTRSGLTGDFRIQPLYPNEKTVLYQQVQELKKRTNGKLRTILSIGGEHFNNPNDPFGIGQLTYKLYSQMVSNPTSRKQFIESAINYAHQYGFDGIDIDWEYPGDLTKGGTPEDFDHFLEFLKECSSAFRSTTPSLLLSFAAPGTVPKGLPPHYVNQPDRYYKWLAQCANYLDRLNVMAYNYHTPFDVDKITGVNAPLYKDTKPSSYLYVANTLDNYLKNGVPANKILLGLPIYGWSYGGVADLKPDDNGPSKPYSKPGNPGSATKTPGLMAYFEIADSIALNQFKLKIDSITNTAYGYNTTSKQWLSFDTPDTITLKLKEAKKLGLGGVAYWAIDLDEYQWEPKYPNIRAALKIMRE